MLREKKNDQDLKAKKYISMNSLITYENSLCSTSTEFVKSLSLAAVCLEVVAEFLLMLIRINLSSSTHFSVFSVILTQSIFA